MKLYLNAYQDIQTMLRGWAVELKSRIFSSPTEFVFNEFPAIPVTVSSGYTFTAQTAKAAYLWHGKYVAMRVFVEGTIAGSGTPCVLTFPLPVTAKVDLLPTQTFPALIYSGSYDYDAAVARIATTTTMEVFFSGASAISAGTVGFSVSCSYESQNAMLN